jgi:hypothetical protein
MKKNIFFTNLFALAFILFLPTSYASAQTTDSSLAKYSPTDIADASWASDVLQDFVAADILHGYIDGNGKMTVKPNNPITRAEFITLLVGAMGLKSDATGKKFVDVPADEYYSEPVRIASSLHIISGVGENQFAPDRKIQRDEIASILVRAFSYTVSFNGVPKQFKDVPDYWAKPSIDKASEVGIISGETQDTFAPFAPATRAEAVTMIYKALHLQRSALPDESVFTGLNSVELLNEFIAYSLMQGKYYNQLLNANDRYTTGYFKALSDLGTRRVLDLLSRGYTYKLTPLYGSTQAASYALLSPSNNFATIEVDDSIYKVTVENANGYSFSTIVDFSGFLYVKKVSDGTWKVYNSKLNDPKTPLENVNPTTFSLGLNL